MITPLIGQINFERLEEKYGQNGGRRRRVAEAEYAGEKTLPSWVHEEYAKHSALLQAGDRDELVANGWVILDQSRWGVEVALGLGEGYYVRAAMLLAN